jgi:hypothetical protein
MLATQKQAIERLRRVQEFLAVNPPPDSPGYVAQKKALDEVVLGLKEHSIDQAAGRRLSRAEVGRQRALTTSLRREHLAPITEIARVSLADAPGIERALRLPRFGMNPVKLVAEASAMRTAAAPHEPRFVEAGLPLDFLQELDSAIEAISQSMSATARNLGQQVGGRAGIEKDIKRGRQVLAGLDAIVKRAFRDKPDVLEKWRSAKRVRGAAGGNGGPGAVSDVAPDIAPAAVAPSDAAGKVA